MNKKHGILALIIIITILIVSLVYIFMIPKKSRSITNFVIYYGYFDEDLSLFDLAIIPPTYSSNDVNFLVSRGVLVLGYLSLTTIGGWEPWAKNVSDDLIIDNCSTWGDLVVNVSDPRRHNIVMWAVNYIVSKGYSGIFLDNLDLVDLYPWMRESIIRLVSDIRKLVSVLCVNRGFSIIEDIAKYVDFILYESFGTTYDFQTNKYRMIVGEELKIQNETSRFLQNLSKNMDLRF